MLNHFGRNEASKRLGVETKLQKRKLESFRGNKALKRLGAKQDHESLK
jgi:hypothetical protein